MPAASGGIGREAESCRGVPGCLGLPQTKDIPIKVLCSPLEIAAASYLPALPWIT